MTAKSDTVDQQRRHKLIILTVVVTFRLITESAVDLNCKNLEFSYERKPLIKGLSLQVNKGEHCWLRGSSGSGKSTLLRLLGGFLVPISGSIRWAQHEISALAEPGRKKFRAQSLGFIHQENYLIDHWTVAQNLELIHNAKTSAAEALDLVHLNPLLKNKMAGNLSGGEKQRVNIARLILQNPPVALIDEPTSHLDDKSAEAILKLVEKRLSGSTVIIVSHDHRLDQHKYRKLDFTEINR
jgi:putative ABC transport system ATP-binding protein